MGGGAGGGGGGWCLSPLTHPQRLIGYSTLHVSPLTPTQRLIGYSTPHVPAPLQQLAVA
jgi:hypothetical protein